MTDPGSDGLSHHDALDVPGLADVEDDDRQFVVHAERDGGRVHHLEPPLERRQVRHLGEELGIGNLLRVGAVHAVDPSRLEEELRLDLHRPQCCGAVGREVGVSRATREDHDAALLDVPHRAAANERLGDRADLDGGHHPGDDADLLERVLQGEAVDDRKQGDEYHDVTEHRGVVDRFEHDALDGDAADERQADGEHERDPVRRPELHELPGDEG